MDISISTTIFVLQDNLSIDLNQAIDIIYQAGYNIIELSGKHKQINRHVSHIKSCGMTVWAVHGTLDFGAISHSENIRQRALEKEFAHMEEASVYAPCPYVIHYLNRYNDPAIGTIWRKSIEVLLYKAEALNLNLALETPPFKPELDKRYADTKELAEFIRSFQSNFISVCVDLNHANLKEDFTTVASNCNGLISNIHVSDNHGKREEHLPPGEGIINFIIAIKALKEAGYKGPFNLECHITEVPTVNILKNIRIRAEKIISDLNNS